MRSVKKLYYNHPFGIVYIILISVVFILSLVFGYRYSEKQVENQFYIKKIQFHEELSKEYNQFVNNQLPEITYYNGYLDSSSIRGFIDSTFANFKFVDKIVFYDSYITKKAPLEAVNVKFGNFEFVPKQIIEYQRNRKVKIHQLGIHNKDQNINSDFELMVLKFVNFIRKMDVKNIPSEREMSNFFFNNYSNRITYMSIPRVEDLGIYKRISEGKEARLTNKLIQQDLVTFYLNPNKLLIKNIFPKLYEDVYITPSMYVPLQHPDSLYTTLNMLGGFSEYKLHFVTSKAQLIHQTNIYFIPISIGLTLLYIILLAIILLIFRDINKNIKMFKLQYDFINNLTHEFKTPVSVIKIAGNNLRRTKTISSQERLHYGKILDEEADKLNNLMNKILAFTQIENRSIKIHNESINIKEFIISTIDSFEMKYPNFELSYRIGDFETIFTDPVLLGSLFDNLIENAYKYSPPNRKKIHILATLIKDNVNFSFKDEGIGILKSEQENIFKKFYRIESKYNQNGSVGLGLAFCKEVVVLLGGNISVKSKELHGSEFIISLPYDNNHK